jgi:2-polyprenyl-6-methoxyphenol hydroxylase-like FAD-dependent oxidoreductase
MEPFDVCVRGAGLVGRSLALLLSSQGLRVALQSLPGPPLAAATADVRAYALNAASVELLNRIKVWDALADDARTAVHDMQVQGDARHSLGFSAWQQGVRELAWIVEAAALETHLQQAARFAAHLSLVSEPVTASLLVLAEGRDSASRDALGVQMQRTDYAQVAVAARLWSDRPHQATARQWFGSPDVLALLPLDRPQQGCSYGLVWSLPRERALNLQADAPQAFEAALQEATSGAAGALHLDGPRAAWPLSLGLARQVVGPGWALVGDAAHVIHPLAGQGLNLGLGDVLALADVLQAREPWRGLGDERLLRRYARRRAAPVQAMAQATDGLLRLFAEPAPLLRELRNRGLTLVDHAAPLKRWLVSRALRA